MRFHFYRLAFLTKATNPKRIYDNQYYWNMTIFLKSEEKTWECLKLVEEM
jgi:hypothetical protein